jgi:3-amino-4-hydroxybenzoic acid synthase
MKKIWFEMTKDTGPAVLNAVFHRNFDSIMVAASQITLLGQITPPTCMGIVLFISDEKDLDNFESIAQAHSLRALLTDKVSLVPSLRRIGEKLQLDIGLLHAVVDDASLQESLALAPMVDILLIDFKDPTNIPLELVLASTQSMKCQIGKRVNTAADGAASFMTMEEGAQIISLRSNQLSEISAIDLDLVNACQMQLSLVAAEVTKISPAGMGDRVCIDTTSMLFQDEGMIVGSTSAGGLITCSETHYLPYMNLRPFRVNAGSLHLYVWGPNNQTHYLSELTAGSEVLVVNDQGLARTVTVGRLKIERRPMLLIEAVADGESLNTFIQDDWHVRMMAADGSIRPSREIKIGEKLLAFRDTPGRHVGIQINETIREV